MVIVGWTIVSVLTGVSTTAAIEMLMLGLLQQQDVSV